MVCVTSSNKFNITSRNESSQSIRGLLSAQVKNVGIFLNEPVVSLTNSLGAFFDLQKLSDTLQTVVKSTACTASVCSIATLKNDLQTLLALSGVLSLEKGMARSSA